MSAVQCDLESNGETGSLRLRGRGLGLAGGFGLSLRLSLCLRGSVLQVLLLLHLTAQLGLLLLTRLGRLLLQLRLRLPTAVSKWRNRRRKGGVKNEPSA